MLEAEIPLTDFSIVPLPINLPELIHNYVPMDAVFYLTIYDDWGKRKLALFEQLGLKTEILWQRPLAEKGLTSTKIRNLMIAGESWQEFVPVSVAHLLLEFGLPQRLPTSP